MEGVSLITISKPSVRTEILDFPLFSFSYKWTSQQQIYLFRMGSIWRQKKDHINIQFIRFMLNFISNWNWQKDVHVLSPTYVVLLLLNNNIMYDRTLLNFNIFIFDSLYICHYATDILSLSTHLLILSFRVLKSSTSISRAVYIFIQYIFTLFFQ